MTGAPPCTAAPCPRPVAAFDFDGTLTVGDSFLAFLGWRMGDRRWAVALMRLAPAALGYILTRDRRRLKTAAVKVCLRGLSRDALAREAEQFAAGAWERLMRPDALRAWARHGEAGDLRVIVTASPEEVVRPFAERLGADALIGSRLAWTDEARVGEGLDGANCRGAEKVRRLRERFGPDLEVADAYGDTAGDREMLALARRGHLRRFVGLPKPQPSLTLARSPESIRWRL